MITRTCEGSNQAQRMVMARIRLICVRDRMGVDVGRQPPGLIPLYRSISYGDEIAI